MCGLCADEASNRCEEGVAGPDGRTRGTRKRPTSRTFHEIQRAEQAEEFGIHFELREIDIQNSPDWDLADRSLQKRSLSELANGLYHVVLITPPCSTWSRVRGANCRGPPPIRSREHPWSFPWLSKRHQKDGDLGSAPSSAGTTSFHTRQHPCAGLWGASRRSGRHLA